MNPISDIVRNRQLVTRKKKAMLTGMITSILHLGGYILSVEAGSLAGEKSKTTQKHQRLRHGTDLETECWKFYTSSTKCRLLPKPGCKGIGFRQISLDIHILYHK